MEQNYDAVSALVRGIHGPQKNVARPIPVNTDLPTFNLMDVQMKKNLKKKTQSELNLQIPTLLVSGPDSTHSGGGTGDLDNPHRRFSFGLRRHSHTTLNRTDPMSSLAHRTLLNFIETDNLAGLKSFLDTHQLQIDDRDENGATALMAAATKGLPHFVRELLARGADVLFEDLDNWTALLCASKEGHTEVVQILLENGAVIEHRDMGGWTALMWAAYKGHTEIVRMLVERNADVHAHGNYHLGPLLWAAGRGYTEIVQLLVGAGAKVNVGDKYGTSALVWACRKGTAEIVDTLLKAGANVDTAGMYSWTALLMATMNHHQECVSLLLERKPNVNALDKDGMTSLSIACREGLQEIASSLIAAGAYVNIQDRAGDTPLIMAVKNGHRGVVESLIKRHADIDIQGKDRKSALYTAVEKGHIAIVKLLLASNPDVELSTKDGDTPLLRAVRNRNLEIVQLLLERKAKVSASDRRGDTCLHIAMRARSKGIVEALLRNPKNSQLLYRANKAGETPYGLDTLHPKTILGQVFGARRLNANEDSEGMLGYDLYSSALADVLSEPTLKTPIIVGLYAKWGSGKSFLLTKVREEMLNFARQWAEPPIKAPWLLFFVCIHLALVIGLIVGLTTWSLPWASIAFGLSFVFFYTIVLTVKFLAKRYDINWAYSLYTGMCNKLGHLRLIMQVAFCHPPGLQNDSQALRVRFHFAEANSAAQNGSVAISHMMASLFDAIESHYGTVPTRLYRAFRPKPVLGSSDWRWRQMCCVPLIFSFEIGLIMTAAEVSLLILYYTQELSAETSTGVMMAIYIIGATLFAFAVSNLHAWAKAINSIFFSQGKHLRKAMTNTETTMLTHLFSEVDLMAEMVKCLDAFTGQQSRLVGVVDALDSCDTERTLSMLNAIQTLLTSSERPFVLLLAVDPHVVAKAAEANSRRLFTEGGIGGHDFLRNLVHLPVYLQNSGLRKVQRAQNTAWAHRRNMIESQDEGMLGHSASARRLSSASEIMSSQEKLRAPPNSSRGGSKKLRLSESVASSIGSNLHKLGGGGGVDITRIILTDDYFSDVNPRSMRRLMNVIYIIVRLLKAFQIDFSWYRLSSWINLTEQWPLRASMIVLEHDQSGDSLEDGQSLQSVYEKVRPKITGLREAAPLLELDRDERKLDAFLQLHKSDLLVSDLRIFLPFTINLDPYLRKVLKEDQQAMEDEGIMMTAKTTPVQPKEPTQQYISPLFSSLPGIFGQPANQPLPMINYYSQNNRSGGDQHFGLQRRKVSQSNLAVTTAPPSPAPASKFNFDDQLSIDVDLSLIKLSKLSVDDIIEILNHVKEIIPAMEQLSGVLKQNAISGRVLVHCELNELKSVLNLCFGHWEIFKILVLYLREVEKTAATTVAQPHKKDNYEIADHPPVMIRPKPQNVMEKQVTLEEQMICGALQTLNEDAFEDVAGSESQRPSPTSAITDICGQFASIGYQPNSGSDMDFSPVMAKRQSILKTSDSFKNSSTKKATAFSLESVDETKGHRKSGRPNTLHLIKNDRLFRMGNSFSIDDDKLTTAINPRNSGRRTNLDESQPLV